MNKIKLSKQTMLSILWDEEGAEGNVMQDKIVSTSRWSIKNNLVFEYQGKLYSADYSVGATEMQDEQPWEYVNEVECIEVEAVEKLS